jgi:hypothetical protein
MCIEKTHVYKFFAVSKWRERKDGKRKLVDVEDVAAWRNNDTSPPPTCWLHYADPCDVYIPVSGELLNCPQLVA